jgi:hypothetical protein
MNKIYRHGEIGFLKISKLPTGIKQSKTNIVAKGNTGNSHTFSGGKIYLLDEPKDFVFGYFVAKDTILLHDEHGENGKAKLPNGTYELLRQQEHTPEGLIPVID